MLVCCTVFVVLLPLCINAYNMEFVRDVLQKLHAANNFRTTVIFLDSRHDSAQLEPIFASSSGTRLRTTQIVYTNPPQQRWAGALDTPPLRLSVSDNLLAICVCHDMDDSIWHRVDERLRHFRHVKLLVLINNQINVGYKMLSICQQLWHMQFLDVLVLQHRQLYTYTPYPLLRVHLIGNVSQHQFMLQPLPTNLHGYIIAMPIESDTPRIFHVRTSRNGRAAIKGFAYEIFIHFVKKFGAQLHVTSLGFNDVNMDPLVQKIRRKQFEISMHPFSGAYAEGALLSYPLFKLPSCLIVPVQHDISHYMYLLRPFEYGSWVLILCAVFGIALVLAWFKPYVAVRWGRFSLAFLESIGYVLFLPSSLKLLRPSKRFICIFALLSVLGFYLTTAYSNLLASFLTVHIEAQQINTFNALISEALPVLIKFAEMNAVELQIPDRYQCALKDLIQPVESHIHMRHLLSFNTSFAYLVTEDRWLFLNMQQQFSYKPIFRFSDICFAKSFVSFIMRTDSHLERPINKFILDVQAAGLDNYWLTSDFGFALQAGFMHLKYFEPEAKALDLNNFQLAWFILAAGWGFATIAYAWECFNARNPRKKKVCHKA